MNIQSQPESTATNPVVKRLRDQLNAAIVGQTDFVDRLLLALFADGHILVEGAPGLAKTKAISTLSQAIDCDEKRIQFTPDLLPGDLTGTEVYRPEHGTFTFQYGPLFHNLILADEINRAPAKVQSALLEAMAERHITVAGTTYPLPQLFMVMATQNPIEQEGTYPLPEAQLDRFMMHLRIGYPDPAAERLILKIVRGEAMGEAKPQVASVTEDMIMAARREALGVYVSDTLEEYMLQLIFATRSADGFGATLGGKIAYGASPRGTIALDRCTRVHAWMRGADFATPRDVQAVIHDVLRHRLILTFEAEADGVTKDSLIDELLAVVPVS
ncbi:MoxR family ATPase [Pseudorhodobacter sp.]|uniref:AAA family ATPase n=1 Tax=Pseudorhodobacter sp. TaxID=1934400 RepID=UPI0026485942|nr:MoxR family ATPase [Pseudorhodobacter sp.]MDN5787957.1 MoxR family ATPase [Pseudorhodobacter sp.]